MEILNKQTDVEAFFNALKTAPARALLLDYDGTLAPFRKNRGEAVPFDGVESIINDIMETGLCRVVLVSGRWTRDLLRLLKLKHKPEVWGSHGWERLMPDGTVYCEEIPGNALQALAYVESWLRKEGLYTLCEKKPASLAVHWRGLDERDADCINSKLRKQWPLVPRNTAVCLTEFDGGIEIRVPGKNKGDAVATVLSELDTDCAVAYLGDDTTDEDAFKELAHKGLRVLVREHIRPTHADVWLTPPGELLSFLQNWLAVCRSAR